MIKNPLVSVITPCFNVEKYIDEYLTSVFNQNYDNIELILINDGSTDSTELIIKKYQDRFKDKNIKLIYIKQNNLGQAAAINKGLKIFKGKYFIWPDADDILHNENIRKKVEFLENNKKYQFVRSNGAYFKKNKCKLIKIAYEKNRFNDNIFFDLILEKTYNSCGCYMISKDLFESCYPDRQIYAGVGSQNWQLLVPAASKSKCGYLDEILYYVRIHSDSFCRKKRNFNEWLIRLDDHKEILLDSFKHSNCDVDYCTNIIKERYVQKKIELAIKYKNRIFLKEKYFDIIHNINDVKRYKYIKVIVKNHLYFSIYRILFLLIKLLRRISEKLKKILRYNVKMIF